MLQGIDDVDWVRIRQVVCEVHDQAGTPTEGRLIAMRGLLEARGFCVTVVQDELLAGTDRYNLYAMRSCKDGSGRADVPATPEAPVRPAHTSDVISAADLHDFLRERLPDYMIPTAYVILDALPLTSNGKVDRDKLPPPDVVRLSRAGTVASPENPLEATLVEVWSEVLGVRDIGIDDNFFELGGDSIRSIQVQAQAQKRGLSFTLQDAFRYQTIRALSPYVLAHDESGRRRRVAPFALLPDDERAKLPGCVVDAYPLAMLQAGMLFHSEYTADAATYHNVTSLRVRGPLDRASSKPRLAR